MLFGIFDAYHQALLVSVETNTDYLENLILLIETVHKLQGDSDFSKILIQKIISTFGMLPHGNFMNLPITEKVRNSDQHHQRVLGESDRLIQLRKRIDAFRLQESLKTKLNPRWKCIKETCDDDTASSQGDPSNLTVKMDRNVVLSS